MRRNELSGSCDSSSYKRSRSPSRIQVFWSYLIRDYLLACFLDSFETNKIRCKIHVTYQFVVAQPNVPAITAPLFHGKPREETDTSRPHPTATPPTPQLLYSPHTTEGRLPVGTSSLPKKETARVSKINPSAFKGKNFVTNSLYSKITKELNENLAWCRVPAANLVMVIRPPAIAVLAGFPLSDSLSSYLRSSS